MEESEYIEKKIKRQLSGNVRLDTYKIDDKYISESGKIKLYCIIKEDGKIQVVLGLNSSVEVGVGNIFPEQEPYASEWSGYIKMDRLHPDYINENGSMTIYCGFRWYEEEENQPSLSITQVVPREVLDSLETTNIGGGSCRSYMVNKFKERIRLSKTKNEEK